MDAGERAAAQADGANGADGVLVGEADVGAGRFIVDGHFRNDGNAEAGGDHAEQAAELAAFEGDLRMQARAIAGGEGVFAEAVAVAKKEEGFRAKILQGKATLARELVRFRKSGEERFREDGKGFKFVAANGQSQQREIDGCGAKAVQKHRSDFFHDRNTRLGKFSGKAGQVRGEEVRSNRRNDADGDGAAHGILLVGQVAASGFEFAQHGAGTWQECLADFGEAHGAAKAVKQAGAEFVLQFADLLRQGWLRDVSLAGSAAEAAGVNDGAEVSELVEFHGSCKNYVPWLSYAIGYAYSVYPKYILDV